jgi:hypothetical protein
MILIYITITMSIPPPSRRKMPKWYTLFHSAEQVWLRGAVGAARKILVDRLGGSKGSFWITHAECCTLAEVRVKNALGEHLKELQGMEVSN